MSQINWEDLHYFLELARHGTLHATGEYLGVSHTTVYRRMRAFQEQLGTRLLEKVSQRYSLTPQGRALVARLESVEGELESVTRELLGLNQHLSGPLVITTTDTLAFGVLPQLVVAFQKKYPAVQIKLKASGRTLSLAKREADIAIRMALTPPEALIGRRLGTLPFGLFVGNWYSPERANEWENGAVVLSDDVGSLAASGWMRREVGDGPIIEVDSLLMAAECCRKGLGAAVLPMHIQQLFDGLTLVRRLNHPVGHAWLLHHRDLSESAKVQVAADFFTHALKKLFAGYSKAEHGLGGQHSS